MSHDWSWYGYELHYIPMKRTIFIEPFINTNNADLPDYKIYCFNGVPMMCQVICNRSHNETISHYDLNYNIQHIYDQIGFQAPPCQKPSTFNTMIQYARILSADFKFVRCDFYEIQGTTYFGEMTFVPGAGYLKYKDDMADYILGNQLCL